MVITGSLVPLPITIYINFCICLHILCIKFYYYYYYGGGGGCGDGGGSNQWFKWRRGTGIIVWAQWAQKFCSSVCLVVCFFVFVFVFVLFVVLSCHDLLSKFDLARTNKSPELRLCGVTEGQVKVTARMVIWTYYRCHPSPPTPPRKEMCMVGEYPSKNKSPRQMKHQKL